MGHGTELAGRYRLQEHLVDSAGWHFWRAVDTTLDRSVGVTVVDPSAAEETLDAARRAALVDDPRLLRVLDAGTEQVRDRPVTFVVSEYVEGVSLQTLLQQGGTLGADTVRTLVGETASALAVAAENGLHHGRLRPSSVLRTTDGSVKVAGLVVEAAVEGEGHDQDPARADAVALVALVYAGLTGRWPLEGSSLEPAPLVAGVPVPPGDLVSGVPNDLDTLCSVTLGPHDDGPRSPEEVARELRPWSTAGSLVARTADREDARQPAAAAPVFPTAATHPMRPPSRFPVRLPAVTAVATEEESTRGFEPFADEPVGPAAGHDDRPYDDRPSDDQSYDDTDDGTYDDDEGDDGYGPGGGEDVDHDERSPGARPGVLLALAAGAVALVVGVVLVVNALGGSDDNIVPTSEATPSATAPATTPPATPAPTESAPPTTAGPPAAIAGAQPADPGGDEEENDETAADAVDDDPETFWRSETYNTAAFGGLKDGVGLALSLEGESTVSGATLQVNGSGGTVELRSSPDGSLEGSTVLASADITGDPVELTVDEPVATQNLLLWFTTLPEVGGEFRVELAGVELR